MAGLDPARRPSSAPGPADSTRATSLESLRWDVLERAALSVQVTPFVLLPRDGVRDRTAGPRLESGGVPVGQKAVLTPPPRPMRKSAAALGLVRKDPEETATRTFAGKEGKAHEKKAEGEDDFDGQETLARRPSDDGPEPGTAACSIDDGETITRPRSKVDVDENDETLTKAPSDDPETVPCSRSTRLEAASTRLRREVIPPPPLDSAANARALATEPAPWRLGAIDPTPPPAPAIPTPLAMVTGPEDNVTRVAPVSPPPRLQAPSNPSPFPQVAPSSSQLAPSGPQPVQSGPQPVQSGAQLRQAGPPLPQGMQPPQSSPQPAPSSPAPPITIQRAGLFAAATLLVAAVVFFVLWPRSSLMQSAAAAEPSPTPVVVEQLPPPAVPAPPVATVITPADLPTPPPTATAPVKASAPMATSHHGTYKRKHIHKHRIPIRREQ